MTDYAALIPVNVVTGFLGSGKTTLLQRLLASPALRDTAVLVNEFGEVGLDHHLLEHVAEGTLLLDNGCICCALRGDLKEALRDLFSRRERGEIPRFSRLVIETSGLADPVPIAYTVLAEPVLQHHFRLGNVVTTIDAVNAEAQLERYPESVKQAAVADRLVLTNTDLSTPAQVRALRARLGRLNRAAPIYDAAAEPLEPEALLVEDIYDPEARVREVSRWWEGAGDQGAIADDHASHDHGEVTSFSIEFAEPLDWTAFGIWLSMLLNRHGENVLRVKGMLNVQGAEAPVLINGVQHIVHPPVHLDAWPDAERRSRLVFIVRELSRARIEASLAVFNALANADGAAASGA